MFSDMVPRLGRGPRPETQAGSNPRGGLLWGYGGVNISPTAVPAPDENCCGSDIDFDFVIDFLKSDEDFEDNDDFEDFVEHLDNQRW